MPSAIQAGGFGLEMRSCLVPLELRAIAPPINPLELRAIATYPYPQMQTFRLHSISKPPINTARANPPVTKSNKLVVSITSDRSLSPANWESLYQIYQTIKTELGNEQPVALMILGLESVTELDNLLIAANQVREEFRKNFPFPMLWWVNDEVLHKLIRLAPDLESWGTVTECDSPYFP